jgi:hypothetical protein
MGMEDTVTDKSNIDRRQFLNKFTSSVAGSATVLALNSSLVQAAPIEPIVEKKALSPKSKGYQRTEHVEKYYQLADF